MNLYNISMLWIDGPLTFLERLCITSFLDVGHSVTLYHYDEISKVPNGVEVRDANEILLLDDERRARYAEHPAILSDFFRVALLLKKERTIWADTDAYCLRPFLPQEGYFFSWGHEKAKPRIALDRFIPNSVFALPKNSIALSKLYSFLEEEFPIPPWKSWRERRRLRIAKKENAPIHHTKLLWGTTGPEALTYFLQDSGEIDYAMPIHVLYPHPWRQLDAILDPTINFNHFIKPDTVSIHFYASRLRRVIRQTSANIHPECALARLLRRHQIDPADAPF